MHRTLAWDEFPNGRWGDSRSPAFGDLSDYHLCNGLSVKKAKDRRKIWGESPASVGDVVDVFKFYLTGKIGMLPWCDGAVQSETHGMLDVLLRLNSRGYLTINSQPRVNGEPSSDKTVGWGAPNGYVYQKAYLEFFTSLDNLERVIALCKSKYPLITYHAVNAAGKTFTNVPSAGAGEALPVNAVTWGVFPNSEVVQPTVVDPASFLTWKDEAFGLWLSLWGSIYPRESASAALIQSFHDDYFLVNIVDNDYVRGDIVQFVDDLVDQQQVLDARAEAGESQL